MQFRKAVSLLLKKCVKKVSPCVMRERKQKYRSFTVIAGNLEGLGMYNTLCESGSAKESDSIQHRKNLNLYVYCVRTFGDSQATCGFALVEFAEETRKSKATQPGTSSIM